MSPALEILAQAAPSVAYNWPTAVVMVAGLIVAAIVPAVANYFILKMQIEAASAKTREKIEEGRVEAAKAVEVISDKVKDATYKVGRLGEVLNEQGQRIDGRLTELLTASIAKSHAEGIIAGTMAEQLRTSSPVPSPEQRIEEIKTAIQAVGLPPVGPTIQPVQIVNPEPIPVVQTPEQRLSEIRGEPK